ncbi:molecular chaperone [Escherichia coli]|uniref:fimbrial biogenesis chaperone n=1 Tax=Escherichia coli TaxID=562 RepID=UPI0017926CD4|nr:molecular chaperone [Escherichia coli]EJE7372318.1 molecular chaperone [Shigella dysenteriae]EER2914990.1 molecular chaperone [Escherichia coli]EFB3864478.1 molecular chaperone [Escherichia coli]EKM5305792.1 molecular chaperone [Escherichia coli]ELO3128910.1 molecular chaperone [Escherichia coli]
MSSLPHAILLLTAYLFTLSVNAGITVGGTRLIYNGEENEASISVSNDKNSTPYLIQSWIEPEDNSFAKVPFIVTPPLFRLDGEHENIIRIIYTEEQILPKDRESIFWLNVKSIPSMEKSGCNQLLIAVKTRIKLFYRPANLVTDKVNEAWKKLRYKRSGDQIVISNPTPYYISLFSLKVDSKSIENPPMITPFGMMHITTMGKYITWKAINDFGGITEEAHQALP